MRLALCLVLCLALGSAACARVTQIDGVAPELPEDIEWLAFVGADPSDVGTGFARRLDGRFDLSLFDGEPPAQGWLIGYRADTFARLLPPAEIEVRRAHASVAQPGGARLHPPADWVAATERADGQLTLTESDERPDITVSWLPPCPQILPPEGARLATSCLVQPCAAQFTQVGCNLTSTIEGCGIGAITGRVGARGELLLASSASFGECTPAPEPLAEGAIASASCITMTRAGSCEAHLIRTASPTFSVFTASVYDVDAMTPAGTDPHRGYLSGLAWLELDAGERVVVGGHRGRFTLSDCNNLESELLLLDPETLAPAGVIGGFNCLTLLEPDPQDPHAVFVTADVQGRRLMHVDVQTGDRSSSDLFSTSNPAIRARSLRLSPDGARIAVLYGQEDSGVAGVVQVFGRDLRPLYPSFEVALGAVDAVFSPSGTLFVTGDTGEVIQYRPENGQPLLPGRTLLDDCGQTSKIVWATWEFEPTPVVYLSARHSRNGRAIFAIPWAGRQCRFATFFEWPGAPSGTIEWPSDRRFLLAGVGVAPSPDEPSGWRSSVALLEKATMIYRSGSIPVAQQMVLPAAFDRRGRVFAYLPFDAMVARIDP
ncbi:MAG: hypothetical protein IT384_29465 [Deltaproteobacteria bacterium]|nr:hypothetical protein [Deltaproteobacteria bacterium]